MRWKPFPFQYQLNRADCGPACLHMIARWYGAGKTDLRWIRDLVEPAQDGASLHDLARAAGQMGFDHFSGQFAPYSGPAGPGLDQLPLPCLLHWENHHFVVLYRHRRGQWWIADPAQGKYRLNTSELDRAWKSRAALLLEPTRELHAPKGRGLATGKRQNWRDLIRPHRELLGQLALGVLLAGALELALPFLTRALVDKGIERADLSFIYLVILAQLALFSGMLFIQILQNWVMLHMGTRIHARLLGEYLDHLLQLPLKTFRSKATGDFLQRIEDQDRIERFLTQTLVGAAFSFFSLGILSMALAFFDMRLLAIFLAGSALYLLWVGLFMPRRMVLDHRRFAQLGDHHHVILELLNGFTDIKLNRSADHHTQRWGRIYYGIFGTRQRLLSLSQWQDIGGAFLNHAKDLLILLVAALAVMRQEMSLGALLAVQFILGQAHLSLQQTGTFLRLAQDARLSFRRLNDILQEPIEGGGRLRPQAGELQQDIHLEEVSFRYRPGQPKVLRRLSATIPFGKITALVGPSGSGKTTLLHLLLGLHTPTGGRIRIGSYPLGEVAPDAWRSRCAAVLQDGHLFEDTLEQNIVEGNGPPQTERLIQAARMAQLLDDIREWPLGFKTPVFRNLSQGQRQRVLLARAFYKAPLFLFWDEATNALDAQTETRLWKEVRQGEPDQTLVFAAHRLSTVRQADHILLLHEGRIAEQGDHRQLLARRGLYYQLVKTQTDRTLFPPRKD